eukprot:CAMPEP_0177655268 /NCGR_PEP_ID=MMETSP0447-20121125/14855_1 /TAXON_ID=0 /ORGANISM="Stygamoeba regulata, Strain BSH-02190019" /LENGTH=306 /DNA_ID=CAMNT_0019159133 /DNA_START=35 /DNA_END=952 /DNA_ORIENTATION=+
MPAQKKSKTSTDASRKLKTTAPTAASAKGKEEDLTQSVALSETRLSASAELEPVDLDADLTKLDLAACRVELEHVQRHIALLEQELGLDAISSLTKNGEKLDDLYEIESFEVPKHCVPIRTDVRSFDWKKLASAAQFDVITMDPPWQLASATPTRGVALGYSQLPNRDIQDIPIPLLQQEGAGFLFIWVINSRYAFALEMMENWGYELVDDIAWVKSTVNRRLAKGHGYYLQHAKETCLVGRRKGSTAVVHGDIGSDVIFAQRRGQSQKPEEIYHLVEKLVPNGRYLEIFSRRNNLRNYWVSIGME